MTERRVVSTTDEATLVGPRQLGGVGEIMFRSTGAAPPGGLASWGWPIPEALAGRHATHIRFSSIVPVPVGHSVFFQLTSYTTLTSPHSGQVAVPSGTTYTRLAILGVGSPNPAPVLLRSPGSLYVGVSAGGNAFTEFACVVELV